MRVALPLARPAIAVGVLLGPDGDPQRLRHRGLFRRADVDDRRLSGVVRHEQRAGRGAVGFHGAGSGAGDGRSGKHIARGRRRFQFSQSTHRGAIPSRKAPRLPAALLALPAPAPRPLASGLRGSGRAAWAILASREATAPRPDVSTLGPSPSTAWRWPAWRRWRACAAGLFLAYGARLSGTSAGEAPPPASGKHRLRGPGRGAGGRACMIPAAALDNTRRRVHAPVRFGKLPPD